tara:strand:+ start:11109 stop:11777 length:669 start_codon:yes stop_codon:yes gene_type:complete
MKKILSLLVVILPWKMKRFLLIKIWKYEIDPAAKIGLAYVFPKHLKMNKGSKIAHFTVAIHLDLILMKENASISRSNWITGFPTNTTSKHFQHQKNRKSELIIGKESAITKNHHIDCTNQIKIGSHTTIAGYYSQFLTHSINIYESRQDSAPIQIGDYCFVGTNSVILGGSTLPSFSVLGAKSMLNKTYTEEYHLYGGSPAEKIKEISKKANYFQREKGFVF